jgi:serine/threonine-protein kinase
VEQPEQHAASIGRVIDGRYRIDEILGQGGMGVVVRARDQRLDRDVALKLLRAQAVGDTQARARLLREAHAMAAFTHPCVVPVHDAGETDDGGAFLVMDLVLGETVRRKLGGPWPIADRLRALVDVARALSAAHRAGLIHRDVKPDNLMVRADGRVVLLDFGIVRVARRDGQSTAPGTLTDPDAMIGTLAYMSPEQAHAAPIDGRSDQFSLGVTAFEVLTGAHPWPGDAAAQLVALLTEPAPTVSSRAPVPAALDAVLARAMAKDPGQRYPSMEALADAIEAATAEAMTAALAKTEAAKTPRPSGETPPATQPAPAAPKRGLARWWAGLVALGLVAAALGAAAVVVERRKAAVARVMSPAPSASAPPTWTPDELAAGTTNPEARAAFLAGLQALRNADGGGALRAMDKARTLDPGYGAAHLWAASMRTGDDLVKARAEFEKAVALRATLSAPNQALFSALQPCIQNEPPDRAACVAANEAAARASPGSPYLWFQLGFFRYLEGPSAAVVADMDRALAADPAYLPPLMLKADALTYLGRFDEALAADNRCLEIAKTAEGCLIGRMQVHAQRGDCAAVESNARAWRAVASAEPSVYLWLARAAIARRAPPETVQDLVAQGAARLTASDPGNAPLYTAHAAVWRGDFDAVRRALAEAAPIVAPLPDQETHYWLRWLEVDLALETGAQAEAVRIAEDTLRRKDAWLPNPRNEDFAMGADMEPYLVDVLREAGKLPAPEAAARRKAWLDAWRGRASAFWHPYLWLKAHAAWAHDAEEAREALATLPPSGIPPLYPHSYPLPDAGLGRMYLLLGRAGEALPYLRRAAQGCNGLDDPFGYVRAAVPLGEALEKTGDREGACRAYQGVIDQWGKATPRSVTAEQARARAKAAGCPAR